MPSRQWFPRAVTARGPTLLDGPGAIATSSGLTVTGTLNLSSGIDWPLTTGPSTGTDLVLGSRQVLITTSDGGYYRLDPLRHSGYDERPILHVFGQFGGPGGRDQWSGGDHVPGADHRPMDHQPTSWREHRHVQLDLIDAPSPGCQLRFRHHRQSQHREHRWGLDLSRCPVYPVQRDRRVLFGYHRDDPVAQCEFVGFD